MRYTATLQRSDDPHVEVAHGDDLDQMIATARDLYCALVPEILDLGRNVIDSEAGGAQDEEVRRHAMNAKEYGWLVSERLRAQEWGIGVYEKEMVFWIGATRDDPDRA